MVNVKELYNKRNSVAEADWEEFPEVLKSLILAMFHSNGEYGVEEAIRYLSDHKVSLSERSGTAKLTFLKWADKVFRNMLMLEFEDSWRKYGEEIEDILLCAEEYLRDLAADYDHLSVMSKDELSFYNTDLVTLAQDLDMQFCMLYWYKEEKEKFEERLEKIFEATKRNLNYILHHEYASELKSLDFYDMDFLPMDYIFFNNIGCLYHGGGAVAFPKRLSQTYEQFASYLYTKGSSKTRDELLLKTESDLQFLYELEIDRIKDEKREDEYTDYLEQCENKLQESKDRVEAIRKPYALDIQVCENEDDCEDDINWERKWEDARRVLKDDLGTISFDTWIEPLSIHHVDNRNGILYLSWPNEERLLKHVENHYLDKIETAVTMFVPEIEKIVILPCDPKMQNQHYHRMWGEKFTYDLRSLMDAYPTVPVVVFCESGEGETESYIADPGRTKVVEAVAHDPKTGEPAEKIIAIYINQPRKIENDFFVPEEEIPF